MDIVKNLVVVLHIISFGMVLGGALAQLPAVRKGTAKISSGIMHGSWALLLTGMLLVGLMYATDQQPNNMKIGVKTAVLVAILVISMVYSRRDKVPGGIFGAIAGLSALNVALAVMW